MLDIIARQEMIRLREGQSYFNLLEVNNGRSIRVYNTGRGNAVDYERLELVAESNVFLIRAVKGGTGTVRNITITTGSVLTLNGALAATGYMSSGASPALAGQVRLPNATAVAARNFAGTADIPLVESNASNEVVVASGGALTRVKGAVVVGAGTGQASTGDIRMASARKIVSRNNAGTGDIDLVYANSSNQVVLGGSVVTVATQLNVASKEFIAPVGASW